MVDKITFPFGEVIFKRELNAKRDYADPNFVARWQAVKKYTLSPLKTLEIKWSAGYTTPNQTWLPSWIKPLAINYSVKCSTNKILSQLKPKIDIELKDLPTTTTTRKKRMHTFNLSKCPPAFIKKANYAIYNNTSGFKKTLVKKYKYFCVKSGGVLLLKYRRKFAKIYGEDLALKAYFLTAKARKFAFIHPKIWFLVDRSLRWNYLKPEYEIFEDALFNGKIYDHNTGKLYRATKKQRTDEVLRRISFLEKVLLTNKLKTEFKTMGIKKAKKKMTACETTKFFKKKSVMQSPCNPEYLNAPSAPTHYKKKTNTSTSANIVNKNDTINNYNMTINFCPIL